MKENWFITEEWNESDQQEHGRRTSHVTAYGLRSEIFIHNAVDCMGRYSHYDYVDCMTCDTKDEYTQALVVLEKNGSVIVRNEPQQSLT